LRVSAGLATRFAVTLAAGRGQQQIADWDAATVGLVQVLAKVLNPPAPAKRSIALMGLQKKQSPPGVCRAGCELKAGESPFQQAWCYETKRNVGGCFSLGTAASPLTTDSGVSRNVSALISFTLKLRLWAMSLQP